MAAATSSSAASSGPGRPSRSIPTARRAYGLLGDAAVEMGDYEAAFKHYQKMLDIRPDLSSYSRGAHLSVPHRRHAQGHLADAEG